MSIMPLTDGDDGDPNNEGDVTATSIEYGRRAISEGPAWDRYPRSSFGSIRMSEFGLEDSRVGKELDRDKSLVLDDQHLEMGADMGNDTILSDGYAPSTGTILNTMLTCPSGETEDFRRFRRSISEPADEGLFVQNSDISDEEHTFRLDFDREPTLESPVSEGEGDGVSELASATAPTRFVRRSPTPLSPQSTTRPLTEIEAAAPSRVARRKKLKLTRNGNTVPALPSSLVKRVAIHSMTRIGKKKPVITRESLAALEQATEWFFEQVGEDLEAYSDHAKRRKRIDDADVVTLMKRQRVIGRGQKIEDLAQEILPDEVLLNLHLPDET